jgi:hypothetical protein
MSGVIPMPSAKIEAGRYVVLGTSNEVIVQRWDDGWWRLEISLGSNEPWRRVGPPFKTKRRALQYCQENPEL